MSRKERRKIYLRLAEDVSNCPFTFYVCEHLKSRLPIGVRHQALNIFKEFSLFKPPFYSEHAMELFGWFNKSIDDSSIWISVDNANLQRSLALLFAAEMCNDN